MSTSGPIYGCLFVLMFFHCYLLEKKAIGSGDPHMITLDGVQYSFNGYGEYHVLQIPPVGFELQGRMQPLIKDNGSNTLATGFKAFAMKENVSDVVQVI